MPHAIRIHQSGGPEVLKYEEVAKADPKPGEVRLKQTAIGLNFIDTYHRSGLYPLQMPLTIGTEAAGVVEATGRGVKLVKEGDRVAYCGLIGAYTDSRVLPADRLVKLPKWIDDKTAAAMMLKGMTAEYLIRRTYRVKKGDTILMHAAAGGVGQIEAFNINILQTKGSLFATRPTLNHYAAKREDLQSMAKDLFEKVGSGAVKIPVNQTYKLKDAQKAHKDLEGRGTTGASILVP
jgi:NADPH:quinone reductase-like Zn-dependent oxidoreductase